MALLPKGEVDTLVQWTSAAGATVGGRRDDVARVRVARTAGPYAPLLSPTRLACFLAVAAYLRLACSGLRLRHRPATYGTLLFVGGGMFGCRVGGLLRPSTPVRPRHDPRRPTSVTSIRT